MPYRSAITQPLQREEHTLQVTEILFSCSESSVLAPLFFFFPNESGVSLMMSQFINLKV